MARKLLNFNVKPQQKVQNLTFTAPLGVDQANLPQILDPKLAVNMVNYIPEATGVMNTRKGIKPIAEVSDITGFQKIEWYYNEVFLVGYGTTLSAVDVDGTVTEIKTDFGGDVTDILRYGNYAFVSSGRQGDKIHRVSLTLDYDAQTADFTAGEIITGGTSGATAKILEDADAGTSGTLTLGNIEGSFQDNETITGSAGGSADVDGSLSYATAEISAAPKCEVLHTVVTSSGTADARLFAGGTDEGDDIIYYSQVDDGTNPPFNNWTTGSGATDAGKIRFQKAGLVKTIGDRGGDIFVGYDNGRARYRFSVIESGGVLVQDVTPVFQSLDHGTEREGESTTFGFYYLESSGLRVHEGSQSDKLVSVKLGRDYFRDVDFSQSCIVHDTEENLIMASYAKDSTVNNEVLVYKLDTEAIFFFRGWNISNFARMPDGRIYGVSAIDGKIYKLFEGFTDDGKAIYTNLTQEVTMGGIEDVSVVERLAMQAVLFEGSEVEINMDIYNTQGGSVSDAQKFTINGVAPASQVNSWGSAGYGNSGWGSGSGGGDVQPQIYTTDDIGLEFYRLAIRMTSSNKTPHTINWRSVRITKIDEININNITKS